MTPAARALAATLALSAALGRPAAATEDAASLETIAAETYWAELDGPGDRQTRVVYYWRPATAPDGPLPTLYMADGLAGLHVAVAELRGRILAGDCAPLLIVAIDADPRARAREYVPRFENGRARFRAHERWFLEVVIPWAEQTAGATTSASERAVGGFSNGADFALAMAVTHPDMFGAVLAHSPTALTRPRRDAARLRWALTAGQREMHATPARVARQVDGAARRMGAARRLCIGPWGHDTGSWTELSPGAIAWALELEDPEALETPLETEHCEVTSADAG